MEISFTTLMMRTAPASYCKSGLSVLRHVSTVITYTYVYLYMVQCRQPALYMKFYFTTCTTQRDACTTYAHWHINSDIDTCMWFSFIIQPFINIISHILKYHIIIIFIISGICSVITLYLKCSCGWWWTTNKAQTWRHVFGTVSTFDYSSWLCLYHCCSCLYHCCSQ